MREHKYRAWDEEYKMMYYSHTPDGSDNPLWCWDVAFRKDWHDGKGPQKTPGIKMQFTGLKDKNGVEIYEGDIVKSINELVGVIVFEDGAFIIDYQDAGLVNDSLRSLNVYDWRIIEVVGNIHENQELIK